MKIRAAIPVVAVAFGLVAHAAVVDAQGVAQPGVTAPAVVLQRAEPIVTPRPAGSDTDTVVAMQVRIVPPGDVSIGAVQMSGRSATGGFGIGAPSAEIFHQALLSSNLPAGAADDARAAFDALRAWRFDAPAQPFTTVVGFNLARTEESGIAVEPIRAGADVRMPRKVRDVPPGYPPDAAARGIQGTVVIDLTIDQAGIPVSAYALRPVEGLTMAAVTATLQWRFEPDATYGRRLITVSVPFAAHSTAGGVAGVAGSVVGGLAATPPRLGAPTGPVRVGGNIRAPAKTRDVPAVLPNVARQAGVRGVVILEVIVGPTGKVQDAKILRSIPLLDQAALDAVRQWEYEPTLLNGTPVPVVMTVTVAFD